MSNQAITYVLSLKMKRSSEKFVLLCMANYANDQWICYPSAASLTKDTCMDRKTVVNAIKNLVNDGYLLDTKMRAGTTQSIPVYQIGSGPVFGTPTPPTSCPENGTANDVSSPKNGTSKLSQNSPEAVPNFPISCPVFPQKLSQKRDTDTSVHIKEPSRNQESKKEKRVTSDPVTPPDWIPLETWSEYLALRVKKKAPNSAYALNRVIRDLTDYRDRGFDAVSILDRSIRSGWTDIYEPKASQAGTLARGAQPIPRQHNAPNIRDLIEQGKLQ